MANSSGSSYWTRPARSAAPAGFHQQQDRAARTEAGGGESYWTRPLSGADYDGAAAGPTRNLQNAPKWQTGGQWDSTDNGYDNDFYRTFFAQHQEAADAGDLSSMYRRQDFTGIATYDGETDFQGRAMRVGDVYENGRRVGNLREQYDRPTADQILGDLTLDARTRREAYEAMANGDAGALSRAVEAEAERVTTENAKFRTQQEYNADVEKKRTSWENTGFAGDATDEILTAIGGFVGGVATTWWSGPWALLGGAAGAGAALMNQDELLDSAARAKVQQDMAGREFGTMAGISTGIMGWSRLAGQFMQPLSNVAHGATDAAQGQVGDGRSEWYATDDEGNPTRPAWLTGLGVAAMLGDSALQFASPLGQAAFQAQMGGSIIGSVGQLATTGGSSFSDTRGAFDNIFTDDDGNFDPVSAAAGIGSVGIDAVQLGMARGLTGMFRRNNAAVADGLGGQTVQAGGRSFRLDADGTAQWARGGKIRSTNLSMLAPSEQLTAISTRVQAARLAAMRKSDVVTADDYYRAATRISSGAGSWGNALVNGVGEGYEEFVQAVLDPISHDDRIDWRAAYDAALTGFGMGAGMGVGAARARYGSWAWGGGRSATAQDRLYAQAALAWHDLTGAPADVKPQDVLTRAAFDKMSPAQQKAAANLSPQQRQTYREALARVQDEQAAGQVAGVAGIEKVKDAIRKQADNEAGKAGVRTDGSFVITQLEDADWRNEAVGSSFDQTIALLEQHERGLEGQATHLEREGGTAEQIALTATVRDELGNFLGVLRNLAGQATAAREAGDRATFNRVVARANEAIRAMYDDGALGADTTAELVDARRRAVTLVHIRNPTDQTGSFQALMPQVVGELAWTESDNVLQISHAILQAMGGDFDGDKIVQQAKLVLDDAAFQNLRTGRNLVGAMAGVNVATRDYEKHEVNLIAGALAGQNYVAQAQAAAVVGDLVSDIRERYEGVLDRVVLDRMLDLLEQRLELGKAEARDLLLADLVREGGDAFWGFAMANRSNELLWVDRRYQQALQTFQRWNAGHVATLNPEVNTDSVIPVKRDSRMWEVLQAAAATEGQTLALEADGWSLFRMFQKLHYSVFNAQVLAVGDGAVTDALRDLTAAYETLSQGITRSALEATGARDEIAQQVIVRLQKIAARQDAPSQALPLVANMAVADITVGPDGTPRVGDKPITMLQLVLRQVIQEDRRANIEVVTPELEAKWARLEQLVKPGASGEAFVEMLGSMTLWELLGKASSSMGPQLTVEQWTRLYVAQGPETRRITSQRLRKEPAYGDRTGKGDLPFEWADVNASEVTSFRSVVESMLETGNNRITLREDGTAGGRIGKRSDQYQEALERSFETIHQALTELGVNASDPATVRAVLEAHPDFARSVLDLIPDGDVNAVFEVRDGQLFMSNWVVEMLTQPAKQAAMTYHRNITLAQWHAKGARHGEEDGDKVRTYRSLDNRLHQLMFRLGNAGDGGLALAEFMRAYSEAKDLDAFLAYVNTRWRASSEPAYAAWVMDVAEFAPDKAHGGWSTGGGGSAQREAILKLRERTESLVAEVQQAKATAAVDTSLWTTLLAAHSAGDAAPDADRVLLTKLDRALRFSQEMLTAEGPGAMKDQLLGTVRTFYGSAHTKGVSPEHVMSAGTFQTLDDVAGFSTQYERLRDTLISVDAEDVGTAPGVAHEELDTMGADGAVVNWDGLDLGKVLELGATRPESLPLLKAMLFPSVYEKNAAGRLTQQFLTGTSLKELLDSGGYQAFFQDSHESRMTFLSMLESRGKNEKSMFVAQRLMNDVLLAHTTSAGHVLTTADHERAIDEVMRDVADIGRMVGDVYSNEGAAALTTIRENLRAQLESRQGSAVLGHRERDREYVRTYFEYELEARKLELEQLAAEAVKAGDTERAERLLATIERITSRTEAVLSSTAFSRFRDSLRIDWSAPADEIAQKKLELRAYVVGKGTSLIDKVGWASEEIRQVISPKRFVNEVPVLANNAAADQAAWDTVLDAVTAAYMETATTVQANGLAVPELVWGKPQVSRYWDPTFSYLLDFLDPQGAFAKAAKTLHERAFGTRHPIVTGKKLESKIAGTILSDDKLGEWSVDIPRVSVEANQRLDSSSAGDAIAMAGIAPRRQWTVNIATERTFETDTLDATVSVGRISLEALVAGEGNFRTDLVTEGGTTPNVETPIYLLNGRFARGARLMYRGQPVADLWANSMPPLGKVDFDRPAVANSGFRAITIRQLRRAAEAALPAGVDLSQMTVEIDYLHPDSQPAREGYYHSIFYEGVTFEDNADQQRSLNATLWFGNGSISPDAQAAALGANKKGKLAYKLGRAFSAATRKRIEAMFYKDFSGMLQAKAVEIMGQDLGNGHLDPTFYNAVLKDVKLRHFVRGEIDGQPVLWSAEQVIAWQRANPGRSLTEAMSNPQLWKPSARVLRTMLGETGDQGAMGALQLEFSPDPSAVARYQGITAEMLARVPNWAGTTDLFSTTAAQRTFTSRLRMRPTVPDDVRTRLDRGLDYRHAVKTQMHSARAEKWGEGHAESSAKRSLKVAEEALRSETPGFDFAGAGFPFITAISASDREISQLVLRDYTQALTLTGREMGWVYEEYVGDKVGDLKAGIITQTSLDPTEPNYVRPPLQDQVAPDDLVVVKVDTIAAAVADVEKQITLGKKRMKALAGHSPNIALVDESGARELRMELGRYLESIGYEKALGSKHLYRPMVRDSRFQTRQARVSTLTETHTETADNLITLFLAGPDSPLPITENAALFVGNGLRTVAMPVNLVPVNAYGSFGVPQGPDMVASVRAQIEGLRRPADLDHLLGLMSQEVTDENRRALDATLARYLEVAGEDGLPRPGTAFGTGDIIPLVNRQGQLLLYRHGMKPPKEVDDQLLEQMVDGDGGRGVAIYSNEPEPQATTHAGTVVRFERNTQYGLTVQLRVKLQDLGNKMQLEANGMKYVLSGAEKVYLPDHDLFGNGVGIDLVADRKAALDKESTGGLLNNFRNAFAYMGIDFAPELTKFFTGQDWAAMDETARNNAAGLIHEILSAVHREAGNVPVRAVQELMQAPYVDTQVETLLRSVVVDGTAIDWQAAVLDARDNDSVETRIARAAILYMLLPSAQPFHILKAGGLNSGDVRADGTSTVFMPRIFTEVFDSTKLDDPLRDHLIRKLNSQINPSPDKAQWYWLQKDFTFSMRNANGEQLDGTLQFAKANSSGDNPVLNGQAFARSDRQNYSRHALDMAYEAIGALTAVEKPLEKTARFAGLRSSISRGSLWEILTDTTVDKSTPRFMLERPGELARRLAAYEAVGAFREPLERKDWTEEQNVSYDVRRVEVAGKFGLSADQAPALDGWVRQMIGSPAGGKIDLGFEWAMETLTEIEWNATHHLLPTAGAEVPQIHLYDLAMLFEANQGDRPTFRLYEGPDIQREVTSWEGWQDVALGTGQIEHKIFDPMYLLATDGFMHSFQDSLDSLVGLPVSRDALVNAQLMDAKTDRLVQSFDPNTDLLGKDPLILEADLVSFADLMGMDRIAGEFRGREAPSSVIAKRRAQRLKWRKENGVPMPLDVTMRNFRVQGAQFRDESANSHAIMRILTNLRAGNALLNPQLWISAGPEMWHRSILDDATNLLMGQGTGVAGQAAAKVGLSARYDAATIDQLQRLYAELGDRTDFKGIIYKELMYKQEGMHNAGRIERWTRAYASFAAGWQDPTYGMSGQTMARRYVEKVLEDLDSSGASYTPQQVIANLAKDPAWVSKKLPDLHQYASNTIAQTRSLRATPISLMLRGIYEPAATSAHMPINVLGHLVRMPLMFSGYLMNVATNVTGMQGFSNMAAMFLEGRDKPGLVHRIQAAMKGEKPNPASRKIDMSTALDGINLAKMFVQGGITHTGLFAMGLAAQGLGLTGEDEEERRRRRAAQVSGGQYLYDPREIQNDFRNADAIFLDWLPPAFSSWFKVTGGEDGEGAKSMAQLPWILKQFISPIIGMERFFDTGDPKQILWGFQDAIGSMPMFNASMWDSASKTFAELMANADAAAKLGTPEDLQKSYGFMVSALGTLERMLFENSFINMIYVGQDRYDRDPWKRPLTDADGDMQFDLMGNPRTTDALTNYMDPETGEVKSGYVNRDWMQATLRQLSEQRLGFALLMSLTTGQGPGNSDFMRNNMVVKQREIDKPELSQEEAEGLILSVLDTESYGKTGQVPVDDDGNPTAFASEVLTEDGARAVFRGLYAGTVGFDSPALEGVFVPLPMRQAIQEKWMAELVAEGLNMGLDTKQAESRMWDIWNGTGDSPYGIGIADVLWSKGEGMIPYSPSIRYNQLNTTYVMGPDGLPYATGVTRNWIRDLFGVVPQRYQVTGDSLLGTDGRLNTIDEAVRLNTGMRSLERVDDSWMVPTDEEIGQSIEDAIAKLGDRLADVMAEGGGNGWKNYGRGGWRNFGRRGYGGGGYGGGYVGNYGGDDVRFDPQRRTKTPYSDDLYSINTSNPIIRRATIRRERFSSQRGRLNQWQ